MLHDVFDLLQQYINEVELCRKIIYQIGHSNFGDI